MISSTDMLHYNLELVELTHMVRYDGMHVHTCVDTYSR